MEDLKQVISYDEESGLISGCSQHVRFDGYVAVYILGQELLAHRVAFFYMTGRWPTITDHIDGNRANNRWKNLREVTASENAKGARRDPELHRRWLRAL